LYQTIEKFKLVLTISALCKLLKVSRTCYEKWVKKGKPEKYLDQDLVKKIKYYNEKYDYAGYRTFWKNIEKTKGVLYSLNKIKRHVQNSNITIRYNKPKIYNNQIKNQNDKQTSEYLMNKIKSNITTSNVAWSIDITYLSSHKTRFYLVAIIDVHDKVIIAKKLCHTLEVKNIIEVIRKAYTQRNNPKGVVINSDRGSQFTSFEYSNLMNSLQLVRSMNLPRTPTQNAWIESFFCRLKFELNVKSEFKNKSFYEIKKIINKYIHYYNKYRKHSSLNYITPYEKYSKSTIINLHLI